MIFTATDAMGNGSWNLINIPICQCKTNMQRNCLMLKTCRLIKHRRVLTSNQTYFLTADESHTTKRTKTPFSANYLFKAFCAPLSMLFRSVVKLKRFMFETHMHTHSHTPGKRAHLYDNGNMCKNTNVGEYIHYKHGFCVRIVRLLCSLVLISIILSVRTLFAFVCAATKAMQSLVRLLVFDFSTIEIIIRRFRHPFLCKLQAPRNKAHIICDSKHPAFVLGKCKYSIFFQINSSFASS